MNPTRRDMLRATGAGLALALTGSRLNAADDFAGLKVGCQSYTYRNFQLPEVIKKISGLGLHYAEFFPGHIPLDTPADKLKDIKKALADAGIEPLGYGVMPFSKDADKNKSTFAFAADLGVKVLSADPDPDSFDSLDKLVEEYKIAIGIHPHGPTGGKKKHRWYSAEAILKAVNTHSPLIGSCLDTGHLIRMGQLDEPLDPVQQAKLMGKRNFSFHLKDHNNETRHDVVFGKDGGKLDLPALFKLLKELKFEGPLSIEYEDKPEDPTADVKACVAVAKEAAKTLA